MKNLYVISGMTGMTGNELARQILKKGHSVIGFDNFFASTTDVIEDILADTELCFFEGDINDETKMQYLEEMVNERKGNYQEIIYINCAAVVHTEYFYEPEATFQTNVLGMKCFLEQAERIGADVFINCSTSEVYSMQSWKDGGVSEEDYILLATAEHSQRTSYAAGKLLTEFFMKDAVEKGRIRGCSLRFANVYSNNELYPKHILPHIITSLIKEQKVVLLENSRENKRTFLHNYDSCAAVLAVAGGDKETVLDGSVYNVATEEEVSILELVDKCAKALKLEKYGIEFQGYRTADPKRRVLSAGKIRKAAGWEPKISLDEGIAMCISQYKKNLADRCK
ncbi:NAD(P)-dependent oxidoreductase [bacterium D16-51]|nr:NAD(P)-dependent oxidoreductase [bacterium D16-59]RKI62789.1 NAD(P)-dependent oxidoreductase [bacterium D16-51]